MSRARQALVAFGEKWKLSTALSFAVLALVYLASYTLEVVFKGQQLANFAAILSLGIWGAFAVDLVIRLLGSKSIATFLKTNWLEIATLVLPFIRILRIFRSLIALRGLRGFTKSRLHATGIYIVLLLPFVWFSGAVAVLDAESSSQNATIQNLKEALWWSLTTITTVGYGDKYPTTFEGQLVAATLMLTGIALFSAAAGMFASWITNGSKNTQAR
jgi:voltage-gated potassium channel